MVRPKGLRLAAIELELQSSPQWRALLHYRRTLPGRDESLITAPAFFLSPEGRTNPGAELAATMDAMFSNTPVGDDHPACRFPARRQWLIRALNIPPGTLQSPRCSGLDNYLQSVAPHSAALVFPEAHINSPASMFGHTLIRLDSGSGNRMLSYSVSYAAALPDDPGPLMPIRGVFGLYRGYFTALPYYEKIKEYSHMEARDIWEYDLNLTPEETRMMALHIWELKDAYADYYFLDDNCAYALMLLIEAARPEADLSAGFSFLALPVETIHAIKEAGLINSVTYRPSRATRITHMESLAGPAVLEAALKARAAPGDAMTNTPGAISITSPALSEAQKIIALDLASEYIRHDYMRGRIERDEYTARYMAALSARSRLNPHEYQIPAPEPPEAGHSPAMLAMGYGVERTDSSVEDRGYAMIRARVAYHALMDPAAGYRTGAAISIFDAEIRHYSTEDETVVNRFMLFEITSLAARGNYVKPVSWGVRLGALRELSPDGWRTPTVLEGRAGMSWRTGAHVRLYGMMDLSLKGGGALTDGYALGGGLSAGAVMSTSGAYTLALEGRALYYAMGHRHGQREATLRQTLRLARNTSISLNARRSALGGLYGSDVSLAVNLYF